VHRGQDVAAGPRHDQLDHPVRAAQAVGHHPQEIVDALAGLGRQQHGTVEPVGQLLGRLRRPVGLVDHDQLGHLARPDLPQHRAHGRHLRLDVGRRAVHHVDQEIGQPHRVEGGPESLDQLVGQLAHEAHRVGHQHRLTAGQGELARARVERHEQPVPRQRVGIGQPVEQRRLPGVGVAHQRQLAVPAPGPAPPLQRARAVHLAQVRLQAVHAADQAAAIDLELGLPRAPGTDATGLLGEAAAPAPQPG
jgi:hypothetical protein